MVSTPPQHPRLAVLPWGNMSLQDSGKKESDSNREGWRKGKKTSKCGTKISEAYLFLFFSANWKDMIVTWSWCFWRVWPYSPDCFAESEPLWYKLHQIALYWCLLCLGLLWHRLLANRQGNSLLVTWDREHGTSTKGGKTFQPALLAMTTQHKCIINPSSNRRQNCILITSQKVTALLDTWTPLRAKLSGVRTARADAATVRRSTWVPKLRHSLQ